MNDPSPVLQLAEVTLGYGRTSVSTGLTLPVAEGSLTMIIGPNGCGKSTALRAMARLLPPTAGAVLLDGRDIRDVRTKTLATRLGVLPQQSSTPESIRVAELVGRGRHPHQGMLRRWSVDDEEAVADALDLMGIAHLSAMPVDHLSGGQRQRVWIAMVLAQRTPVLLLDEPTTYLDLTHQLGILDLLSDLVAEGGRTVVAVVHDLAHACRYATHLVAMRDGAIVAAGPPEEIVSVDLVREVFDVDCVVIQDPVSGTPLVVPSRAGSTTRPLRTRAEGSR